MEAFPMVVGKKFLDDVAEMALAKEDEVIQALGLYGLDKSLRVWVAIGTVRRNPHAFHAVVFQDVLKCLREQRVSVVDQVCSAGQKPIDHVGEIPRHPAISTARVLTCMTKNTM